MSGCGMLYTTCMPLAVFTLLVPTYEVEPRLEYPRPAPSGAVHSTNKELQPPFPRSRVFNVFAHPCGLWVSRPRKDLVRDSPMGLRPHIMWEFSRALWVRILSSIWSFVTPLAI